MSVTPEEHIEQQILKSLQDDCSEEELQFLENWKKESPKNIRYYEKVKVIWEQSDHLEDFDKVEVKKRWAQFKERTQISKKSNSLLSQFLKVAASIALLLGMAYFVNTSLFNEITLIAETGKENKFILPDASVVWLRDGSRLKYTKNFEGTQRLAKLTGEGYFEIEKNPDKPFVVVTNGTQTKVMGTSFNLVTDLHTKITTLNVVTGKVAFSFKGNEKILLPGEQVIASADGTLLKTNTKNVNFLSWKSGVLQFDNQSLKEVIPELEAHFHVSFEIKNKSLLSCLLTSRFDQDTLDDVLKSLQILFNIEYKVKANGLVVIRGGNC